MDSHPTSAQPVYGKSYDAYNATATGHQRAENRPGTGWRDSRNRKLHSQFLSGNTGGKRMSDTVGAGSEDFDEKLKAVVPKAVRARAKASVVDMLVNPGMMKATLHATESSPSQITPSELCRVTPDDG
jgi:hypothetical protein